MRLNIITAALLIFVTNAKGEDKINAGAGDMRQQLEKKGEEEGRHHIVDLEEECQKIDLYYELIADELIVGRSINWSFLHNTGLFKYLYEEKVTPETKKELAEYNKLKAEQTVKHAIQKGIGSYGFYELGHKIDILSCRFQNKPECFEVWKDLVAKYAPKIQDATSPFAD